MLKLVKYDLKRYRDQVLGVFAVVILCQIGIEIGGWDKLLHLVSYAITGVIMYIIAIIAYNHNLRSYHRRLLPIKTLSLVLSPLLLCWILLLGVAGIMGIHFGLYLLLDSSFSIPEHFWPAMSLGLLEILWSVGFMLILVMLPIAIARSLRFKGGLWIGIAVFFILQNGISYIEVKLFGDSFSIMENSFQFQEVNGGYIINELKHSPKLSLIGLVLFEVAVSVIVIGIITFLAQKRIES